jgi:signal transduction histidine kinase
LRKALRRYTLRRAAVTVVAATAFMAGMAASSVAIHGEADPGVQSEGAGQLIGAVSPTGFAWREGIRPRQLVVALSAADDPGGWRLETSGSDGLHVADSGQANDGLRASLPLGLAALIVGASAVLLLGARRAWVVPTSACALVLASTPLALHGNAPLSTLGLGAAAILPAGWAVDRLPGGRIKAASLATVLCLLLVVWATARLGGHPIYDGLETVRAQLAIWGTVALLGGRVIAPRLAGEPFHVIRPRAFDAAAVALMAGGALVLVNLLSVPPLIVAVPLIVGIVALPALRRQFRPIEDALLADVRQHAAAEAAEAERARLARELHDVPLQELMGVIRRLEILPGAEREHDDLRAVAGHLRNVAMDLRPPVLDDLGLPAALEYLSDETTTPERPVVAVIGGRTGLGRTDRPPEDVELAMFRIAVEAVANALHHSAASEIKVTAEVFPRRVELEVADNGSGVTSADARKAITQKHMGLASMRRRAEAIDADFEITDSGHGTIVRAAWQG